MSLDPGQKRLRTMQILRPGNAAAYELELKNVSLDQSLGVRTSTCSKWRADWLNLIGDIPIIKVI